MQKSRKERSMPWTLTVTRLQRLRVRPLPRPSNSAERHPLQALETELMSKAIAGSGADFVPMEDTPAPTRGKRDPLGVKVKPKRGKSSRKQKQRIALKLDKVMLHPLCCT